MKVDEGFEVSINETESVKESVVSLNTQMSGKAETVIPKINGCLKAIILEANIQCQVVISLKNHPEIIIFEKKDYYGSHYIPLRITPVSKSANAFNYGHAEWYLNDEIIVSVSGQLNTVVDCVIRWV